MDYASYKQLEFRRKFFKIAGASITMIYPETQAELGFIKMQAWKLRGDVRLYRDSSLQQEIVRMSARKVLNFGATYDVFDSSTNQLLFSLQRKGWKSAFVRDHWNILDATGNPLRLYAGN